MWGAPNRARRWATRVIHYTSHTHLVSDSPVLWVCVCRRARRCAVLVLGVLRTTARRDSRVVQKPPDHRHFTILRMWSTSVPRPPQQRRANTMHLSYRGAQALKASQMDSIRWLRDIHRSCVRDSTPHSSMRRARRMARQLERNDPTEPVVELDCDDCGHQVHRVATQTHPPGTIYEFFRTRHHPQKGREASQEVVECAICFGTMSSTTSQAYPCAHTFHRICIEKWERSPRNKKKLCPMCRHPKYELPSIGAGSIYRSPRAELNSSATTTQSPYSV